MKKIAFPNTLRILQATYQATYIVYAIGLNKEKVKANSTEWKSVPISFFEEVYLRTTSFLKKRLTNSRR